MPPVPPPRRHAVKRGRNTFVRRRHAATQHGAAAAPAHDASDVSRTLVATPLAPLQGRGMENSVDIESVYSDFDLVTDVMQEVLFGSSSDEDDDTGPRDEADGAGGALSRRAVHCMLTVSPFMTHTLCCSSSSNNNDASTSSSSRRRCCGRRGRDEHAGELVSRRRAGSRSRRADATRVDEDDAHIVTEGRGGRKRGRGRRRRSDTAPRSLLPALSASHNYSFTVVLDLDETLVCVRQGPLYLRPGIAELLDVCAELRCEVVVWTAGTPTYVNDILRAIGTVCGRTHWFHHIISRHRRWCGRGGASYAKDLRHLRRPLERLVIIENNPLSVALQPAQAILVEDYTAPNEADNSLAEVSKALRYVARKVTAAPPAQSHVRGETTASIRRPKAQPHVAHEVWTTSQALARCVLLTTVAFDVSVAATSDAASSRRGQAAVAVQSTSPQRVECRALKYTPLATQQARLYGCMHPVSVTTPERLLAS